MSFQTITELPRGAAPTPAELRVVAHLATIPVNLLLIAWVGVGRTAFLPDGGDLGVRLTLTVLAPTLTVLLGVTSALAIRQHRPADGYLTAAQVGSLLGCWLALTGFGFFLVDTGPSAAGTASPFTQLAGPGLVVLSDALTVACLYGFVASWIALLILLIRGLRGADRRRRPGRAPVDDAA